MDDRKALFRAKLREAQKQEKKRIDSPLVRYNENDQPVCRVCNVPLKSESIWPAHQVSKKHREAVDNLKATAAGLSQDGKAHAEKPRETQKSRPASALPAEFFDNKDTKRQKKGIASAEVTEPIGFSDESGFSQSSQLKKGSEKSQIETEETSSSTPSTMSAQPLGGIGDTRQATGALPENFFDQAFRELTQTTEVKSNEAKQLKKGLPDDFFDTLEKSGNENSNQLVQTSKKTNNVDTKHAKGALPEGFFDNKDADLRARGIEPVKVDINDAYKEFEKEIQSNLQVVDDRLEEEEIDAADEMEEYRSMEQKEYKERVEEVKKKLMQAKTERLARAQLRPVSIGRESNDETSSDDSGDDEDDDEDNFAVDWRAQHL